MALSSMAYPGERGAARSRSVAWSRRGPQARGLILLSGGPDGPVNPLYAAGKTSAGDASPGADAGEAFGDRLYVELQRHNVTAEAAAEPGAGRAGPTRNHTPLVATNDVYYANPDMARPTTP